MSKRVERAGMQMMVAIALIFAMAIILGVINLR